MTMDGINVGANTEGIWSPRLIGIRETVEDLGKFLPPGDDWMPTVLVDGIFPADMPKVEPEQIGKNGMLVVGLGGDMMNGDANKDLTATLMMLMAIKLKAKGMTFISTVWVSQMVKPEGENEYLETLSEEERRKYIYAQARAHGRPADDPNRKERLMLLSVYFGGPDDGTKIAFADIKRDQINPPTLHDWTLIDGGGENFFGRFPEAIYAGLKIAREVEAKQ